MAMPQTVLTTIGTTFLMSMMARGGNLTREIEDSLLSSFKHCIRNRLSNQYTMVIEEYDGLSLNELYGAIETYIPTKINPNYNSNRVQAFKSHNDQNITFGIGMKEDVIVDSYDGVKFTWSWTCKRSEMREYHDPSTDRTHFRSEIQSFEVTFPKKHEEMARNLYLPHILEKARARTWEHKTVKMFTTNSSRHSFSYSKQMWNPIPLRHPTTFETLAMEPHVKEELLNDLDMFARRKEKYRKVGKTWKRGYLLFGPPGTGKSSLVAAMANHLKFDVYDLELTDVATNSDLRRLLVSTTNRSILLVEDIDCNVELHDRATSRARSQGRRGQEDDEKNRVTLSGFLNFIDGLWSTCGEERIIIFTTNRKEMLDPALLRPGRMDMHINMSYCTPSIFKILARNYLEIEDHERFKEIEKFIVALEVTPADVAEQLLKSDSPDIALKGLEDFLRAKSKKTEKEKEQKARLEGTDDKMETDQDEPQHESNENKGMWLKTVSLGTLFCGRWFAIFFLFCFLCEVIVRSISNK